MARGPRRQDGQNGLQYLTTNYPWVSGNKRRSPFPGLYRGAEPASRGPPTNYQPTMNVSKILNNEKLFKVCTAYFLGLQETTPSYDSFRMFLSGTVMAVLLNTNPDDPDTQDYLESSKWLRDELRDPGKFAVFVAVGQHIAERRQAGQSERRN